MRENIGLFRGKRVCNGKWMEGYLLRLADGTCLICQAGYRINRYKVDPDSIGECTSLKDKNGKLIFEGDVVRILGNQTSEDWKCVDYNALIAFLDGGFCALDGTIEDHGFRRYALARMDFDLEIIGNIHDNPELLEGGEG